MTWFVPPSGIVRRIWGKSDTILFIFAGAAGEFALNKAVDWLYFTGKLPADPLGRLFSTVQYARQIVFATEAQAHRAIDAMRRIHETVEQRRGDTIPDWAYRDVLFMLIHYSIAAFEALERPLQPAEKQDVYDVFYRVGTRMGLRELPPDYAAWLPVRAAHMAADLQRSPYTADLFAQYRKHLGGFRYLLLLQAQRLVVPPAVARMLGFTGPAWLKPVMPLYRLLEKGRLSKPLKTLLLPKPYLQQILELDVEKPRDVGVG